MSDVRVSWLSIAFIALGTMTSIYLISQLKFDYDFEDFFPKNDPETEYFLEFRKSFETDNDFFIVNANNCPGQDLVQVVGLSLFLINVCFSKVGERRGNQRIQFRLFDIKFPQKVTIDHSENHLTRAYFRKT